MSRFQLVNHCVFSWVELSLSFSLSLFCLPFLRKTDDESEQGMNAANIIEERKWDATSTRTKEEHVKKFEGFSQTTMMKATAVVNMVLVSREYPMIALRLYLVYIHLYVIFLSFYNHHFHRLFSRRKKKLSLIFVTLRSMDQCWCPVRNSEEDGMKKGK
jgi:hypothetical protein